MENTFTIRNINALRQADPKFDIPQTFIDAYNAYKEITFSNDSETYKVVKSGEDAPDLRSVAFDFFVLVGEYSPLKISFK